MKNLNVINKTILNDFTPLTATVKQAIPNSILEIQIFISCAKEKLRKLQSKPDRDVRPYNASQMNSVAILYGEAKIGHLLEEAGVNKDEQLLLAGISRENGDFFIKLSQYDKFIDGALDSLAINDRVVAKCEFSKFSPNGDKILKQLINKDIAKEHSTTEVELRYSEDINIEDVRKIAGSDFDKIWPIFHLPHDEVVTWKHVFQQAFFAGEFDVKKL